MKIDLNKYVVNKNFVQHFYRINKEVYGLRGCISLCATSTGCPCIAVTFYLGEDIGFVPELIEIINRFIKFYGYTAIIGAPESYYLAIKE